MSWWENNACSTIFPRNTCGGGHVSVTFFIFW